MIPSEKTEQSHFGWALMEVIYMHNIKLNN